MSEPWSGLGTGVLRDAPPGREGGGADGERGGGGEGEGGSEGEVDGEIATNSVNLQPMKELCVKDLP